MALLYSVAKYYFSVWEGNTHCTLIDTELKKDFCIITGIVKSIQLQWLPVQNNSALPIYEDRIAMLKLKFRHPFLAR